MTKRNTIIYWVATLWLALGMVSTGLVQLFRLKDEVAVFTQLGYPAHLMTILGVWKILGVAAILVPKFPVLKEWAYAGFFFVGTGAILSHLASGNGLKGSAPGLLILALTAASWYFRPVERKLGVKA